MNISEASIARSERGWFLAMVGVAGVMFAAMLYATLALHMGPPSNIETIDPNTLHLKGEFVEGNLGTRVDASGQVTARLVTTQFAFQPQCVVVPQDTPVTFRLTSPDVIHGLLVMGTNVNTMVVPGYISQVRTRFAQAGEMLMPCHEFCGLGHSQMIARVRVVPKSEFKPDNSGRVACDPRQ